MTVSCGLCGQRGIVGESGEDFGLGTITVLGSRCLPPPLPRWASPGAAPPQGARPPHGGGGGPARGPGGGGAGGGVARRRRRKICGPCTKCFFGDLCRPCVGYARASRGLAGSSQAGEGLRGVAGSSSRAAVERASKAMGSRTLDFRGRCLGWLAFRECRLGRTRTGQTPEGALARRPLLIGKNPNPRKGRGG